MSARAHVVPIIQTAPAATWADVEVRLPPPQPRIDPGVYQARSASLREFPAYGRRNLEIGFDVFAGEATDGVVLARVPFFCRRQTDVSPQSRLAQLFYLLGVAPTRRQRVSLSALRDHLWIVDVADTRQTFDLEAPTSPYSVIRRVTGRIA